MDAEFYSEDTLTDRAPRPMQLAPDAHEPAREREAALPDDRAFDGQDWVTLRVMDSYN